MNDTDRTSGGDGTLDSDGTPTTDDTPDADGTHDDTLRTVGVLGGMSPASTAVYYEEIVGGVNDALGGHSAAPVVVWSVDFADVEPMVHDDRWDAAGAYLSERARRVERAGADFLLVATNTMHRVADAIEAAVEIPFVHIVDPVADAAHAAGCDTLGVLGTQTTMADDFYRDRFHERGIETVVPDGTNREELDRVIFEELVHGEVRDDSREWTLAVIDDLCARGADGVVFGCTEIELLLDDDDVPVPVFDTTALHVERAVELSLGTRSL